jgi:hypothetical protein
MEQVAGNTLFRLKAFVHKAHGADAWARIVGRLPPSDRPILRGVVLSNRRYDRTLYQGLLAAIDAELGRAALLDSARAQAEEQFASFFGLVLRLIPTDSVLERAGEYWRKSWSGGELRLSRRAPELIEVEIRDFEMPEVHRAHNQAYFAAFLHALTHDAYAATSEARGPRESVFRYSRMARAR